MTPLNQKPGKYPRRITVLQIGHRLPQYTATQSFPSSVVGVVNLDLVLHGAGPVDGVEAGEEGGAEGLEELKDLLS